MRWPGSARYSGRERIASGGMGVIFRAYDALREQEVAFKRLVVSKEALRAQMTALFEREFRTLARLAHPGIVEAYDYGIDQEGPYYTMELLVGSDLRKGPPLPPEQACKVLCEVASALGLLHAQRLVHRDLSPANVLLTRGGHAKLIDFGALAPFGRPAHIVGTAAFVAPECLEDRDIDQRTDLYALGALAYWILTGERAIRAGSFEELPAALARELVPPSERAPGLPTGLDELVLSLLQHDPLARPESAAYVIDRLCAIAGLPMEEDSQRVAASYAAFPPLIGRAEETRQLESWFRESVEGRGQVVWIEGPQGAGRSALLDQLALHAQLAGATVLRAQGGTQGPALSLARSLVGGALAAYPALRALCERAYPGMTAFCLQSEADDLRSHSRAPQTPTAAAEAYAELMQGLQDCLLELSRAHPLAIVVDDLHRADAESLGLLASLAHEARERALFLLVSAESNETGTAPSAFRKLVELGHGLRLSPLTQDHVTELVSAIFGTVPNVTRLARWLYTHGEGHPQRTLDLLRLLLQRGVVRYQGALFSLPYEVDDEIGAHDMRRVPSMRLSALDADARRAAQLLSIEEEALPIEVLAATLKLQGPRLFAALESAVDHGIAVKLDGRLALSRPFRWAAESSLSDAQRGALHLALARALLLQPSSLDHRIMAGFHLLRGGRRDEGADTLASAAVAIAYRSEGIVKAVPALEQALEVYRAQGRPDAACLRLLVALTVAGFYGDPRLCMRYFERTYQTLLHVSGTALARRLSRFLGDKLALLVGLVFFFVTFWCTPRAQRPAQVRQAFTALFGVAVAGAAAMTCAYEQAQTVRIGERLSPFAALGRRSGAHAVREFCQGLSEIMLSVQADCAARMRRLVAQLSSPRGLIGLDDEARTQMRLGAIYVRGISEVYAGNPEVLALAAQLEQSGRAFSKPRAALLRMCHYGFRGEQQAADRERSRAEALALLGGTSWSAMTAMAVRQLLIYQWTRDSVGLLRVVHDLQNLAAIAPALDTHRELGEAYLALLRGHPAQALARYERLLDAPRAYPVVNWQSEQAHRAQALDALGRHEEAREICLEVVSRTREVDRRMRFLYQPAEQELALSEASLGRIDEAASRLQRLIDEVAALDNPLLSGALHRDRCRVALLARDSAGFEAHLGRARAYFWATQNPCLIQQYETLAVQGAAVGLRRPTSDAPRPLEHARPAPQDADASARTTAIEGKHAPTTGRRA